VDATLDDAFLRIIAKADARSDDSDTAQGES